MFNPKLFICLATFALLLPNTVTVSQIAINGPDGNIVNVASEPGKQVLKPINLDPDFDQQSLEKFLRENKQKQINGAIIRRQFGETGRPVANGSARKSSAKDDSANNTTRPQPHTPPSHAAPFPVPKIIKSPYAEFNDKKSTRNAIPIPTTIDESVKPTLDPVVPEPFNKN